MRELPDENDPNFWKEVRQQKIDWEIESERSQYRGLNKKPKPQQRASEALKRAIDKAVRMVR